MPEHSTSLARQITFSHSNLLQPLDFPLDAHLLVTTEKAIYAWHKNGIEDRFSSVNGGINAAEEAGDGSRLLAVADSHVVVMIRKGKPERQYSLKRTDGRVGLLAYANNFNHLLFSTSLTNSVRCYSIPDNRILDFYCAHSSPPTVLAASSNSKYVISASRSPPVIYLQELASSKTQFLIKPLASDAFVTVAAFHLEREEIFLLGYGDGTLSVHSASRIILMRASGSDGNISHLKPVRRIANARAKGYDRKGNRYQGRISGPGIGLERGRIRAAAFMSGYKLRTVSIGRGYCRIVDFEYGAKILRTWNLPSRCSSLAVFPPVMRQRFETDRQRMSAPSSPAARTINRSQPSHIIAVGGTQGGVDFYDDLGLLRSSEVVDQHCGHVIGIKWVRNEPERSTEPEIRVTEEQHSSVVHDYGKCLQTSTTEPTSSRGNEAAVEDEPQPSLRDSLRRKSFVSSPTPPRAHNTDSLLANISRCSPRGPRAMEDSPSSLGSADTFASAKSHLSIWIPSRSGTPQRKYRHASGNSIRHARAEGAKASTGSPVQRQRDDAPKQPHAVHLGPPSAHTPIPSTPPRKVHRKPLERSEQTKGHERREVPNPPMRTTGQRHHSILQKESSVLADLPSPLSEGWETDDENSLSLHRPGSKHSVRSALDPSSSTRRVRLVSPPPAAPNRTATDPARHARMFSPSPVAPNRPPPHIATEWPSRLPVPSPRGARMISSFPATVTIQPVPRNATERRSHLSDSANKPPPVPPFMSPPLPNSLVKSLPRLSPDDISPRCDCNCANIVQEDISLLRSEIASLRKGLWVFGGRIEDDRLKLLRSDGSLNLLGDGSESQRRHRGGTCAHRRGASSQL